MGNANAKRVVATGTNQCLEGKITQTDTPFFPVGTHILKVGKVGTGFAPTTIPNAYFRGFWYELRIPFPQLMEGTALATEWQRTLKSLPWYYRRWQAESEASRFFFVPHWKSSTVCSEEFLNFDDYELSELLYKHQGVLAQARQTASDVRGMLQSFFESGKQLPGEVGVIAVSDSNYSVSVCDLKAKRIKKRIPLRETGVSSSSDAGTPGPTTYRSGLLYGTLEGMLYTFKLRFEQN